MAEHGPWEKYDHGPWEKYGGGDPAPAPAPVVPGTEKLGGKLPGVPTGQQMPEELKKPSIWTAPGRGILEDLPAGFEAMAQPGLDAKAAGASQMIRGLGKAALPFAMIPAVMSPAGFITGLAGGVAGAMAGKAGARALGAPPGVQSLSEDAGGVIGGAGSGWLGNKFRAGLPSMENAGKNFDLVMGKAGDVPLDVSKAGDVALRAHELAGRGASLPKVIRDFTNTATKPDAPPLTYRTGRDFASNASRLSAQENAAMAGPMKRQVALFSKALNESNADAAEKAGVRPLYDSAMREYRNAARLQGVKNTVLDIAKNKAVRAGAGALGAGYVAGKLLR